jgi:uncharacterized membrane protein
MFEVHSALTLESNRMLGGAGALLIVLGSVFSLLNLLRYVYPSLSLAVTVIGSLFAFLSLAGYIIFMIAMNGLANYYKDRMIFNNVLYALLVIIVGAIVAGVLAFVLILSSILRLGVASGTPLPSTEMFLRDMIGFMIPVFIVVAVFAMIEAIFFWRAFNRLAAKSQVGLFRTSGLLFLMGAAVSVTVGLIGAMLLFAGAISVNAMLGGGAVGGVVVDAAWALVTASMFRIRKPATETPPIQPAPQTIMPTAGQVKYCPNCKAENLTDAAYCTRCGQKL